MLRPYNRAEVEFTFVEEIGHEGSNSKAYRAHDPQLGADIVIKEVPKSSLDLAEYFEESKTLHLSSHPNVVPVYYACQDANSVFIAMPYFANGSLSKLLDSRFLTVREIVVMGLQIASGLHNVHSKRLIHFDVKPDNVLLSDRNEALLSDFGLSKKVNAGGLAGQDRMYYKMRPPEAFTASEFSLAFDVYQFGLTLYRMCNGNRSFNEQFGKFGDAKNFDRHSFKHAVVNGQFPDRTATLEHIPARLKRIIIECLQPDPLNRPAAIVDVANDLSLVDERFDWRYTEDSQGRRWAMKDKDRERCLTVAPDGKSIGTKTMLATGKRSRIMPMCKDQITDQEVRKFLGAD